ncbi:MAG: hypothetical protein ACJ07L_07455 [Opitutales bacterium]
MTENCCGVNLIFWNAGSERAEQFFLTVKVRDRPNDGQLSNAGEPG